MYGQKILLMNLLSFLAFSLPCHAGNVPITEVNFTYLEVYPNSKISIILDSKKSCEDDQIQVESFNAQKSYPSTETQKEKKVSVKNIYVTLSRRQNCLLKNKSISKEIAIPVERTNTSHLYIIFPTSLDLNISK